MHSDAQCVRQKPSAIHNEHMTAVPRRPASLLHPLLLTPMHLYACRMPCTPATSGLLELPFRAKPWLVEKAGGRPAPNPKAGNMRSES